jgi:sugar lactone lactonase YvrE
MPRTPLLLCCCATGLLLAGCPVTEPIPEPQPCEGSAPGTVEVIADGFVGTEGIAFSPDGRLFVSDQDPDGDYVAEVFPDGSWEVVAQAPGAIGLAWWGEQLLVASSDSGLGDGTDGVFRVDVDSGEVSLLGAAGLEGANFVTVTPWGALLVSDPQLEVILSLEGGGGAEIWLDPIQSPNGMAFTEGGDGLWVVSSYGDPAPVWFVPVDGGQAAPAEVVHEFGPGTTPDGVALGASGDLYVAQVIGERIDRVTRDGAVTTAAVGVEWTASIAFGEGADWDECSLYATSLWGTELYRIDVGETGLPLRR